MKRVSKNIHLVTISFLMAPMILSTHAVLASESEEISEKYTISESLTTIENSTETANPLQNVTITIDPKLFDRIELKTQDGQVLTEIKDGVLSVKPSTKLSYTILSDETQKPITLEIYGVEEMDADAQTFVAGTKNIFITILEESTPDIPSEDSSKPNEDETVTDNNSNNVSNGKEPGSSTNQSTGSSDAAIDSEQGSQIGSSANNLQQTKPGHSIKIEAPKRETSDQTNGSGGEAVSKAETIQSKDNLSGSIEDMAAPPIENFLTKTPINMTILTNTNAMQQAIVQEALKHLGKPYIWGAKGPSQFDCSGLAYYVYMRVAGYFIGTWTGEQQYAGTQIPIAQAQPGDLLFWGSPTGVTTHVGIYLGENQFIHAPQPGEKVKITSISEYTPDFAARIGLSNQITDDVLGSSSLNNFKEEMMFTQNQSTNSFLQKIGEAAREIGQKEGIYASVMLAQAILESGSGNSHLSREPNYNLFGIKGQYKGQSIIFDTFEQDEAGKSYQVKAEFRKYSSYKESLEDYAQLIKKGIDSNKDFYKPMWKSESDNYKEATSYLQGHYATDKQYAQKLNKIIETYDLTRYDTERKTKHSKLLSMPLTANILFNESMPKAENVTYYFTFSRILSIFELRDYFSLKKIPKQQQIKTIKANELTSISRMILKKMFLLNLLSLK